MSFSFLVFEVHLLQDLLKLLVRVVEERGRRVVLALVNEVAYLRRGHLFLNSLRSV